MDVTGRIGCTTSGADCVGSAIVGAGIDRMVVSGRVTPGFGARRTLSPATGAEADRAEKTRAISISAVGSRGEKLYSKRRPLFRAGRTGDDPARGGSRRIAAHEKSHAFRLDWPDHACDPGPSSFCAEQHRH